MTGKGVSLMEHSNPVCATLMHTLHYIHLLRILEIKQLTLINDCVISKESLQTCPLFVDRILLIINQMLLFKWNEAGEWEKKQISKVFMIARVHSIYLS